MKAGQPETPPGALRTRALQPPPLPAGAKEVSTQTSGSWAQGGHSQLLGGRSPGLPSSLLPACSPPTSACCAGAGPSAGTPVPTDAKQGHSPGLTLPLCDRPLGLPDPARSVRHPPGSLSAGSCRLRAATASAFAPALAAKARSSEAAAWGPGSSFTGWTTG